MVTRMVQNVHAEPADRPEHSPMCFLSREAAKKRGACDCGEPDQNTIQLLFTSSTGPVRAPEPDNRTQRHPWRLLPPAVKPIALKNMVAADRPQPCHG